MDRFKFVTFVVFLLVMALLALAIVYVFSIPDADTVDQDGFF